MLFQCLNPPGLLYIWGVTCVCLSLLSLLLRHYTKAQAEAAAAKSALAEREVGLTTTETDD